MKNKIKNLFAKIPTGVKSFIGIYLAGAIMVYVTGAATYGFNPLEWDNAIEARMQQKKLRERKLGFLAGPAKIIVSPQFDRIKITGMYGSTYFENRINEETTKIERKRLESLAEKIFGENGYADTDRNGAMNLNEIADAYTKMGLGERVLRIGRFPNVKAKNLERAIQIYEAKR